MMTYSITRNAQKALLFALLQPNERLIELQNTFNFSEKLMLSEEIKTLPFGDIWEEFCKRNNVPANDSWFAEVQKYEKNVLSVRG